MRRWVGTKNTANELAPSTSCTFLVFGLELQAAGGWSCCSMDARRNHVHLGVPREQERPDLALTPTLLPQQAP